VVIYQRADNQAEMYIAFAVGLFFLSYLRA
jgi:hypothetical protein